VIMVNNHRVILTTTEEGVRVGEEKESDVHEFELSNLEITMLVTI